MTTRATPFVAWVALDGPPFVDAWNRDWRRLVVGDIARDDSLTPVVVTPLLPDDPRPGETWRDVRYKDTYQDLEITGAPYRFGEKWCIGTRQGAMRLEYLRRSPALKTFRLRGMGGWVSDVRWDAVSKEAMLKLLADSIEEVP